MEYSTVQNARIVAPHGIREVNKNGAIEMAMGRRPRRRRRGWLDAWAPGFDPWHLGYSACFALAPRALLSPHSGRKPGARARQGQRPRRDGVAVGQRRRVRGAHGPGALPQGVGVWLRMCMRRRRRRAGRSSAHPCCALGVPVQFVVALPGLAQTAIADIVPTPVL